MAPKMEQVIWRAERGARIYAPPQRRLRTLSQEGISVAKYDTIVTTDADGSYPIEQIPALVKRYEEGFDMVVGARTGQHYRESALKSPLRAVLKAIVEFTANRRFRTSIRVYAYSAVRCR